MNCVNKKGTVKMSKMDKKTYQTDIGLTLQITHDEQGIAVYIPELDLYTCADTESELLDVIVDLTEEYWLQLQANPSFREREPMCQHYFYYINTVIPALEKLRKPTFTQYLAETIAIRLLPLGEEAIHA
jgi:hypothetical protein